MKRLILILRVLTILGLIILAVMGIAFKFGDCDQFKRTYNHTELTASQFMEIYSKQCFPQKSKYENNSFDIGKLIVKP